MNEQKNEMNMCVEWCSNCEHEVEINAEKVSICPICGNEIKPCSMCDMDKVSCNQCEFDKEEYRKGN